MNTRVMNVALLVKWIWRLFNDAHEATLWHRIIRAKYPGAADIFGSNPQGGSPFWRTLHKIKHYFKLGAKFTVGNGSKVRFWTDLWTGDSPLSSRFVRLFQISAEPEGLIS
jgi:mannosylglycoprotein endo-beta-mannosidase